MLQIDLRFGNEAEGSMAIVVAPVLRFADVGFNADVRLKELGSPDKMIGGFGPELFGSPLQVLIYEPYMYTASSLQNDLQANLQCCFKE